MQIAKTNLAMSAKHTLETHSSSRFRLDIEPRADQAFAKLLDSKLSAPPARLLALDLPAQASGEAAAQRDANPFAAVLEMLFGIRSAAGADGTDALSGKPEGGRRLRLIETEYRSETESCSFAASGNVCLADGSTRQFAVGYRMDRHEESTVTRIAELRDPLMIDQGEPDKALSARTVDFDLDADGKTESMRMPGANSALLFVDRNRNGRADDGSELFGPQSGDGFADLAKLDGDGNGWVDGGDTAYADLKLWQLDADGKSVVRSLADAGIGALSTANEKTPFTLKKDGETLGQVRSSGIWLGEHDGAGIVRQVDVAVNPHREPARAEHEKKAEPTRSEHEKKAEPSPTQTA